MRLTSAIAALTLCSLWTATLALTLAPAPAQAETPASPSPSSPSGTLPVPSSNAPQPRLIVGGSVCEKSMLSYVQAALRDSGDVATHGEHEKAGIAYLDTGCPVGYLLSADHRIYEMFGSRPAEPSDAVADPAG